MPNLGYIFSCHFLCGFLAFCLRILETNKCLRKKISTECQDCLSAVPFTQYSRLLLTTVVFLNFNFSFPQPWRLMKDLYQPFLLNISVFLPMPLTKGVKRRLDGKISRKCQVNLNAFLFLSEIFIP